MRNQTSPPDIDSPCACCGRTHRKLHLTNYGWVGATCKSDIEWYLRNRSHSSPMAQYEPRKFAKVDRMFRAGNARMQAFANSGKK